MKKFFVFENVVRMVLFALFVIAFVFADMYVWHRDVATAVGMAVVGGVICSSLAETGITLFVETDDFGFNFKGILASVAGVIIGAVASLLFYIAR